MPSGNRWSSGSRSAAAGVLVPRPVFQRRLPERPTPERCVEAYYLRRTRFESIAERKLVSGVKIALRLDRRLGDSFARGRSHRFPQVGAKMRTVQLAPSIDRGRRQSSPHRSPRHQRRPLRPRPCRRAGFSAASSTPPGEIAGGVWEHARREAKVGVDAPLRAYVHHPGYQTPSSSP
jgi:hypothetical protein